MDFDGMAEHRDDRLTDLPIYYLSNHRDDADSMIVLMPSALPAAREDRARRSYARWSWHTAWPRSLVIAFADPALQLSKDLDGGWFIHPEHDVLATISKVASEIAEAAAIPPNRVIFYGSSLGGFGALSSAAHMPGARAVAEVPQINVGNWSVAAVTAIEDHILHRPISAFEAEHPERIRIHDRFKYAGLVPPLRIISNQADSMIADQTELLAWCHSSVMPRLGEQILDLTQLVVGHKTLPRGEAIKRVVP